MNIMCPLIYRKSKLMVVYELGILHVFTLGSLTRVQFDDPGIYSNMAHNSQHEPTIIHKTFETNSSFHVK